MAVEGSAGWTGWLLNAAYASCTLCAGALMLLYVFQDKLLYFPTIPGASKFTRDNPQGYRNPGEFGIDYEDLMIPAADRVRVHAWLMKQPNHSTRPTIIFFHGNAGNIGYRLPNAVQLYRKVGANVLLVDYRGFGHSEGEPSEKGLKLDAEAVLDTMYARTDIDKSSIIVFGRSLGGAVSVYLAEKAPSKVAAVIVENTFLSISSMVDSLMPFLSYVKPIVLRIDWNSEKIIQKVTHPILFVAGKQDELVPHHHMTTLHKLAVSSKRAVWFEVRNGTHNDTWLRGGDRYFETLRMFLDSVAASSPSCSSETSCTPESADVASASSPAEEGAIPNMLQQPLINSLHKIQKPKGE